LEQSSTEGKITSYRQGRQPPARKKRWVGKDAAMKRIDGNYHLYENRLMEFLDSLTSLPSCKFVYIFCNSYQRVKLIILY
jgi:hypothetical protein